MFSEICHRLQTARPSKIKCLLYYLLPWLYNMELVDGAATAANTSVNQDVPPSANVAGKQEAEQAGQQLLNFAMSSRSGIIILFIWAQDKTARKLPELPGRAVALPKLPR